MLGYYAIFDDDNGYLTLAPKIGASFKGIGFGSLPERFFTAWDNPSVNGPVLTLMALISAGGVGFALLA